MKKLIFLILLCGVHLASGSSDLHILYVACGAAIIKAPTRVEINIKSFADHLGLIESSKNWKAINSLGCIGKYQIAPSTLRDMGYHITPDQFKANPGIFPEQMQDHVLNELIKRNLASLKNYMQYIGQTIKGVIITRSGLIAAAHLSGIGGVKKYLTSASNPTDINGASVQKYLNEFKNYPI